MSIDEVVEGLGELGLSPYEARVYYALVQRSPLNGHEISRQSGVPTSKVYETLERLRHKGAVLAYESDPVKYAPRPYQDLLTSFSDRMTRTVEKVSRSLATVAMDTDAQLTWSVTGRGNVVESMRGAIRGAQQRIRAVLDAPEAAELSADLAAARAKGRRVDVVPASASAGDGDGGAGAGAGGRLGLVIGDDSEAVIGAFDTPSGASGIWTHQPAMSLLAVRHFETLRSTNSL